MTIDLKDRLIVSLDVPSTEDARAIIDGLGDTVSFYKIGLQLFPIGGVKLAHDLVNEGKKVFLDFKFFDIGNTVKSAVQSAASLDAEFLTVHGDREIVAAAVDGRGRNALKLLAVTVLTSLNQENLSEFGIQDSIKDLVLKRARIALDVKCDGVIASAQEVGYLRDELGHDFLIVAPGIRSAGTAHDDQKRVTTPGDAIKAGADHLVVGREITRAVSPREAAEHVLDQIDRAL